MRGIHEVKGGCFGKWEGGEDKERNAKKLKFA